LKTDNNEALEDLPESMSLKINTGTFSMQRLTLGSSSTRAQTTFSMPSRKGKNVSKTGDNPITQTEF
jgi:hypothetical protein